MVRRGAQVFSTLRDALTAIELLPANRAVSRSGDA